MKRQRLMRTEVRVAVALLLTALGPSAHAVTVQFQDEPYQFSKEERSVIREIANATEAEVRKLLPALDDELTLVVVSGKNVIEQTSEGGVALAPGTVLWTLDHERSGGAIAIARAQLRHTLFHEFHHLVRGWLIEGGKPKTSFMDGVVSEGMATAFSRDYSGEMVPWSVYPPDDVESWVDQLQNLPAGAQYGEWMFLHPDGRQWIGYRAGTYLVDRATKASGKTSIDLITIPADEVIELGSSQR